MMIWRLFRLVFHHHFCAYGCSISIRGFLQREVRKMKRQMEKNKVTFLNQSRPLTPAEAEAFREVFLVENTYHSNLNRWHYFISVLKASTHLLMEMAEQGACL